MKIKAAFRLFPILLTVAALPIAAHSNEPIAPGQAQTNDIFDRIDKAVHLTVAQKPQVQKIVDKYRPDLDDPNLTRRQRRETTSEMIAEIKPLLTEEQAKKLDRLYKKKFKLPFNPQLSVSYQTFYPSDSLARSIFGTSSSSFSVGLGGIQAPSKKRTQDGFSLDTFSIGGSNDKLFVFSPQLWYEYRVPIAKLLTNYERISAGPSYMDYSFNLPNSGPHLAAKRFGAEGAIEAGVRYGRVQVAATYRLLTEPAGVDFDGLQFSIRYVVVRF